VSAVHQADHGGLTNCERVGRGFDAVKPHLHARLQQLLGDAPDARLPKNPDLLALLKMLLEHWNGRIAGSFPPPVKQYAHLLRDVRNRCAHGEQLSNLEARHALDTLRLLAVAVDVPPASLDALDRLTAGPTPGDPPPPPSAPRGPAGSPVLIRAAAAIRPGRAGVEAVYEHGVIMNAADLTVDYVAMQRVLCPACRRKTFEEWPAGWDAHAGSPKECDGLLETDPIERKAEFRRRFCHLFRPSTQRNAMCRWHRWFEHDHDRVIREYAADERCGAVPRARNAHGLDPEAYARALLQDGLRKGWLRRCSSRQGG
jgi:hypothetical protein